VTDVRQLHRLMPTGRGLITYGTCEKRNSIMVCHQRLTPCLSTMSQMMSHSILKFKRKKSMADHVGV